MTIEFYWQDLTPKKQEELLGIFGDNGNWDVIPFCTIETEDGPKRVCKDGPVFRKEELLW